MKATLSIAKHATDPVHVRNENKTVEGNTDKVRRLEEKRFHISSEHNYQAAKGMRKDRNLIINNIFWSDISESYVPKGVSFEKSLIIMNDLRSKVAKTFRPGNNKMCGDRQNAIVGLENGSVVCARYRHEPYFVYAEILAFYLSRLLKTDNIPEVVLAKTDSSSELWRNVDTSLVSWESNQTVSMTRQLENVRSSPTAPTIIRDAYLRKETITDDTIKRSNLSIPSDIVEVIQWGTVIVFDYLINHYDRLSEWLKDNKNSLNWLLHNSLLSNDGKLWLVDNEKCFFYPSKRKHPTYASMEQFNEKLLKTLCVFQSSFVKEMQALATSHSPFETLWKFASSYEPLLDTMERDSRYFMFVKRFNERLRQILRWVHSCKELQTGDTQLPHW